jgi:beta-galactosidase
MKAACALALPALLVCVCALSAASGMSRERILMDAGWRFHLGDFQVTAAGTPIMKWRWKVDERGDLDSARMAAEGLDTSGPDWKDMTTGDDLFAGAKVFVWVRTSLPQITGGSPSLHFESIDDEATIYLNGQKLMTHEGWDDAFDLPLGSAWRPAGPNVLVMQIGNSGGGPGGVRGPALLQTTSTGPVPADSAPSPSFNDRAWRKVDLPHDFVVEGTFDEKGDRSHGYLPKTVGWYRKEFNLPAEDAGKTLWLEFDGIYRNSTLWLNGRPLARHLSGYTSFHCDITDLAKCGGRNVLAVRVDASGSEGWWYEGGGIYRHVYLTKLSPLHVDHWGTFVSSVVRNGDKGASDEAALTINTAVANDAKADTVCHVVSRVVDPAGREVCKLNSPLMVKAGTCRELTQKAQVAKPLLWSVETPQLYRLETTILRRSEAMDSTVTPFGIRTIRFDADKGFFLNGKPVKIKGTCNHQDLMGVGIALPDRMHTWRIERLKEMGSNAYRCSHNPPAAELLDACDRLGMLVMDENRHLGSSPEILSQVGSMVKRDRNHPSILMWSMCNEERRQGTPEGAAMFVAMRDTVHRFDTTRPVSCAMNGGWGSGITGVQDLQGFNYNPRMYDPFHKDHPTIPVFASETASHVSSRGEYSDDRPRGYVSQYSGNPEGSWKPVAEREWVAGSFVWTGFDYRGEPSPYDWPCINSHFGIMDTCGFPKDSWWYYKAWWGNEPVVHAFPHWNWQGKEGQEISVWAYSNCEKVELLVNGQSVGAQDMPRYGHVSWKVKYVPGSLEVRGITGDKVVVTERTETTGEPASVRLTPDRTEITADNEDVAIIPVAILDAAGRRVPTADNKVVFSVEGPGRILGVGNGDPSSHEPDKASSRSAFHGYCMVIVQSTAKAGAVRLTAQSAGLKSASVTIRTR